VHKKHKRNPLLLFIYNKQRFHISSGLNVGRRHSYFGQPDYRIYELNKRLQQRTEVSIHSSQILDININILYPSNPQESDNCWWDSFANEFFEDDAQLTLTFCLEDGPKRYSMHYLITLTIYFIFIAVFL
jgi:LIM domain-binding protein 1